VLGVRHFIEQRIASTITRTSAERQNFFIKW